jgi:tetratricopeptide (TPR) repeat protein
MAALGNALFRQERLAEAERLQGRSVELYERLFGREERDFLIMRNGLAETLRGLHKYDQARQLYQETLEISRRTLGSDDPVTHDLESGLAVVFYDQTRFQDAVSHFRRVLQGRQQTLGHTHPATIMGMSNLANSLREQGNYEEAEKLHQEAYALSRSVFKHDHWVVLNIARNYAETLGQLNRDADAEEMLRLALESMKNHKTPGRVSSHGIVSQLLYLLQKQGRVQESEQLIDDYLEWAGKPLHPDDIEFARLTALASRIYWENGEHLQALKYCEAAYDIFNRVYGADDPQTKFIKKGLGAYRAICSFELATVRDPEQRDPDRILALAQSALELVDEKDQNYGPIHDFLGIALIRNNRWQEAVQAFNKAAEINGGAAQNFGFFRAIAHWQTGNRDHALEQYARSVRWMEKAGQPDEQVAFRAEAESVIPREAIETYLKHQEQEAGDTELQECE